MNAPLLSLRVDRQSCQYSPGDELSGQYQIDAVDTGSVRAIELSVLWHTEGKGDEDLGVHHFQRITFGEDDAHVLEEMKPFTTVLPSAPLSYDGVIIKLRWSVRLRVFMARGKSYVSEAPFRLGSVPTSLEVRA